MRPLIHVLESALAVLSRDACAAGCGGRGGFSGSPFCCLCGEHLEFARHGGALYEYGGPVAEAICRFKYGGHWELGRSLGLALGEYAKDAQLGEIDVVVPVPLHARRRRQRGYNQAELLAREVARCLRIPMRRHLRVSGEASASQVTRGG